MRPDDRRPLYGTAPRIAHNALIRANRVSVLIFLAVALAAPSCAPAPPPVQAAKALNATAVSVDTAMKVAGDLYRSGVIADPQKAQILQAYNVYQRAARVAYSGIKVWNDKADGRPVDLRDVQAAANALIELVNTFTKKGP